MTTKKRDMFKRSKECAFINSFNKSCLKCIFFDNVYSCCRLATDYEWNRKEAKEDYKNNKGFFTELD